MGWVLMFWLLDSGEVRGFGEELEWLGKWGNSYLVWKYCNILIIGIVFESVYFGLILVLVGVFCRV